MACKIEFVNTDNKESSILFKKLEAIYGPQLALENYVKIIKNKDYYSNLYGSNEQGEPNFDPTKDAKFKEVEFNDPIEELDVTNMLSTMVIDYLKTIPGVADPLSIAGINFDRVNTERNLMSKIVKNVRTKLGRALIPPDGSPSRLDANGKRVLQIAYNNFPNYLVADKSLGIVGRALLEYGIKLSPKKTFAIEETDMLELLENESYTDLETTLLLKERIYDLDVLEASPLITITPAVKAYLRGKFQTAKDYKYSSREPIRYEKTKLNTEKAIDTQAVYGKLFEVIAGSQTLEEMHKRLITNVDKFPILAPIVLDVDAEFTLGGVEIESTQGNFMYKPISVALFAAFSKANYNMFTVTNKKSKKKIDQVLIWVEADKGKVTDLIKKDIGAEVLKVQEAPVTKRNTAIETLRLLKSTITSEQGEISDTVINRMATNFKNVGFKDMSAKIIKDMIETIKHHPMEVLGISRAKPRAVFGSLYENVLIPILQGKDIFSFVNNETGAKSEGKYLNFIIQSIAKYKTDIYSGGYRNNKGVTMHSINKSSESQDMLERFRSQPELYSHFKKDPIYENSLLLDAVNNKNYNNLFDKSLTLHTLDTVADSNIYNSGKKFKNVPSLGAIAVRMAGYEGSGLSKTQMYAISPTLADRGSATGLVVEKQNVSEGGLDLPVFNFVGKTAKLDEGDIKNWISNTIEGELKRMASQQNSKIKYENYHIPPKGKDKGRAFEFTTFPELNELVNTDGIKESQIPEKLAEAMGHMDKIFSNIILSDLQFLKENKVITTTELNPSGGSFETPRDSKRFLPAGFKNPSANTLINFLANNFIYTTEQVKFLTGDPAFYKSNVDVNKRLGLPSTPGEKPAYGEGSGIRPTFTTVLLKEPKYKSKEEAFYKALFNDSIFVDPKKDREKLMSEIEHADGTGVVSLQRYKELHLSLGLLSTDALNYIDSLIAWKPGSKIPPNPNNIKLEVIKGFYHSIRVDENEIMVPTALKYSIFPAVPHFYERTVNGKYAHEGMAQISRVLREGLVDEVVVSSATKTGRAQSFTLKDLKNNFFTTTTLSSSSYRLPQPTVSKDDIETRWGSQIRKLVDIIAKDGYIEMYGKSFSEASAQSLYQKAISAIVTAEGTKLNNRFIKADNLDIKEIVELLLEDLYQADAYKNVAYTVDALAPNGKGGTVLPVNYPTTTTNTDSKINSTYRNRVNRFQVNGYPAVQITSMGMVAENENKEISTDSDLNFITISALDGTPLSDAAKQEYAKQILEGKDLTGIIKVVPAEIRVTPKYFLNTLKEQAKRFVDNKYINKIIREVQGDLDLEGIEGAERSKIINETRASLRKEQIEKQEKLLMALVSENGRISIEKIKKVAPELLETVLYRIPTQAKSSMLPANIVGFLDDSMGSVVQVPAEIVEQSGSDFDIDKVYIQTRGFSVTQDGVGRYSLVSNKPTFEEVSDAVIKERVAAKIQEIKANKENFVGVDSQGGVVDLSSGKEYVAYKDTRTNKIYSRISDYTTDEKPVVTEELKSAVKIGNKVDTIIRDVFNGKEITAERLKDVIGSVAAGNAFIASVKASPMYQRILDGSYKVLAEDVIVYDNVSKTAGTLDLLLYNDAGEFVVVDTKTMKRNLFEANNFGVPYTSKTAFRDKVVGGQVVMVNGKPKREVDPTRTIQSYEEKHSAQLSGYRAALLNTHGVLASAMFILPVKVQYEPGDTKTSELKLLPLKKLEPVVHKKINANLSNLDKQLTKEVVNEKNARDIIFEYQRQILMSPNYITDLLLPTSTTQLKKAAEEFGITDSMYTSNFNSFNNQETLRINNNAGKDLISIMSIASTAHSVARHLGVKFKENIKVDGKIIDLQREKDFSETHKIADIIKELQNAALDNANDPILGKLNVDQNTAGTIVFLVSGGMSLEYALNLVNAPIVKEWARLEPLITKVYGDTKKAEQILQKELQKKFNTGNLVGNKNVLGNYSLENAILARTSTSGEIQKRAFQAFMSAKAHADNLGDFQRIMNFDSSGTDSRASEVLAKAMDLSRIEGTLSNLEFKNRLKAFPISVDPVKYRNHSISSFEEFSVISPLRVNRLVSIAASDTGAIILAELDRLVGDTTPEQKTHILSEFNTFLAHNSGAYDKLKSGLSILMDKGEALKLLDGSDGYGLANQIEAYKNRTRALGKEINPFIEQLNIINNGNSRYVVFNNTKAAAMTGSSKLLLMRSFEDLMGIDNPNSNEMDRLLAKSLANYAAIFYGFAQGVNSYMNFLPPSAHVHYMGAEEGVSLPDYFARILEDLNNPKEFNKLGEAFIDSYVANNFHRLPQIKLVRTEDDSEFGDELELLTKNKKPKNYELRYINDTLSVVKLHSNGSTEVIKKGIPGDYSLTKYYGNPIKEIELLKNSDIPENKASLLNMEMAQKIIKEKVSEVIGAKPKNNKEGVELISNLISLFTKPFTEKDRKDVKINSLIIDIEDMESFAKSGEFIAKRKGILYEQYFEAKLLESIEPIANSVIAIKIAEEIQNCN